MFKVRGEIAKEGCRKRLREGEKSASLAAGMSFLLGAECLCRRYRRAESVSLALTAFSFRLTATSDSPSSDSDREQNGPGLKSESENILTLKPCMKAMYGMKSCSLKAASWSADGGATFVSI